MELIGAKEVSDMIGVPVGTLRYWRHSNIGRRASRWAAESCTGARRFCDGSRSARMQAGGVAATPRDLNLWERPRGLVVRGWRRFERGVPPPLGAFAFWSRAGLHIGGWCGGWSGQRRVGEGFTVAVGDFQCVGGPGQGDDTPMVQAVVERADEHQIPQLGGPAVLPVGVDGGRSVRACRPGYFPPPRPRTGRAALTASGSP